MPDAQPKLVKVNDLGVVAFPSSMPDDKISAFIKKNREAEKFRLAQRRAFSPRATGKTTEEGEHERLMAAPLRYAPPAPPQADQGPSLWERAKAGFYEGTAPIADVPLAEIDPNRPIMSRVERLGGAAQNVLQMPANVIASLERGVVGLAALPGQAKEAIYQIWQGDPQGVETLIAFTPPGIGKGLWDSYQKDVQELGPMAGLSNLTGSVLALYAAGKIVKRAGQAVPKSIGQLREMARTLPKEAPELMPVEALANLRRTEPAPVKPLSLMELRGQAKQLAAPVPPQLMSYAQEVVRSGPVQSVTLVGSTAVKGAGHDVDMLYDFGNVDLEKYRQYPDEVPEELIEHLVETTGINAQDYDSFYRVNGKYYHLSSGAGRAIVENTDYAKQQQAKPKIELASKPAAAETPVPAPPKTLAEVRKAVEEKRAADLAKSLEMPNVQAARSETGKLKLGADPASLGKVLGSSLYSGDSAKVITKELVQNAMDAVRESAAEKNVTVEFDTRDNTIQVTDTGKGMTKDQLETVFTDLGASGKRGMEEASGGFGLAKAAPLMMSKSLHVETVVWENGILLRHSFDATPDDLLGEGVDIKTEKVDPAGFQTPIGRYSTWNEAAKAAEKNDWLPELMVEPYYPPTGTIVRSTLPEKAETYGAREFLQQSKLSLRPPGEMRVVINGVDLSLAKAKELPQSSVTSTQIPGAGLDLYVSHMKEEKPKGRYDGIRLEIHNNGIFQFEDFVDVPEGVKGVPQRVAVDVRASVPEGDPEYPFLANRESMRGEAMRKIKEFVKEKVIKPVVAEHHRQVEDIYNNLPMLDEPNSQIPIFDSGGRLTPEELAQLKKDPAVNEIADRIFTLTANAITKLEGSHGLHYTLERVGKNVRRVGIVLSSDVHGVYIGNPADEAHATIFINPFLGSAYGEIYDPDEAASLIWHTIKHELIHDKVKGHDESFTTAEAAVSRALGGMEIKALTELRAVYADPNDPARIRADFDNALRVYKSSRGRSETTPDILRGEESRAPLAGPAGGGGGERGLPDRGEATVPGEQRTAGGAAPAGIEPVEALMNLQYTGAGGAEPFYLKSEKVLGEKMKGPMPAADIQKMLTANGVKPDEMKWTGLDEFLKEKGSAKVTPQEMQEYLAANNLQIKEVMRGRPKAELPADMTGADLDTKIRELSNWPDDVKTAKNPENQAQLDGLLKLWDDVNEFTPTKFGTWTMPGGENYREMLLTLPPIDPNLKAREAVFERYRGPIEEANRRVVDPNLSEWEHDRATRDREVLENQRDHEADSLHRITGAETFHGSHWNEPNVVGHIRFNDRVGPNGEKLLHLEELQSDWHQKGRTRGYKGGVDDPSRASELARNYGISVDQLYQEGENWFWNRPITVPEEVAREGRTLRLQRDEAGSKKIEAVPDAPFKKTWPELLLKRMVRYAAENGYDGVTWTPGAEQVARYPDELRKVVDRITWTPAHGETGEKFVRAYKNGEIVFKGTVDSDGEFRDYLAAGKHVDEVIGKSMGSRILQENGGDIEGKDFTIGGEGMKGFYDKMLPETANKLGKQYGTKVGETKINLPPVPERWAVYDGENHLLDAFYSQEEAQEAADDEGAGATVRFEPEDKGERSAPYFPITDALRESVMKHGQPLFNLVYKQPAASEAEIADAWRQAGDYKREIEKIPWPGNRDSSMSAEQKAAWDKKYQEWKRQAQPLIEKFEAAGLRARYLQHKDIGEIRKLPTGEKVLYLKRHGLESLFAGLGDKVEPGIALGGLYLDARNVDIVLRNLEQQRPLYGKELSRMLRDVRDQHGNVIVSRVPNKGETVSGVLAGLREELNHAWQGRYADAMGNHLPPERFSQLYAAMPKSMRDYLLRHGYNGRLDTARIHVLEASAKFFSDAPVSFGLTRQEVAAWLSQYLSAVEEQHGAEALDNLFHVTNTARAMKKEFSHGRDTEPPPQQRGPVAGNRGEPADAGGPDPRDLGSVEGKGHGRDHESAREEGRSLHEHPPEPLSRRVSEPAASEERGITPVEAARRKPTGWDGFNFRTETGSKPIPEGDPPERTADGDPILYHGTSAESAKKIREEGFRNDNLGYVGFGTRPGVTNVFRQRSGSTGGRILRFVVDKDWLRDNAKVINEGGHKNLYLLQAGTGLPLNRQSGKLAIPPEALKSVEDITDEYLEGKEPKPPMSLKELRAEAARRKPQPVDAPMNLVRQRLQPPKERLGTENQEGRAPAVDWYAQDLQDSGRVTEASLLRDYNEGKPALVYQSYIDVNDIPDPVLAEEEDRKRGGDEEDDEGSGYDWEELRMSGNRRSTPPIKVRVTPRGKVEILDGNHRLRFWQEQGYDSYPAWVIDQRKGKLGGLSEDEAEQHKSLKELRAEAARRRQGQMATGGRE
jgi:hypothetical protein